MENGVSLEDLVEDSYRRTFVIRKAGGGSKSFEVTIPHEVVERFAKRLGTTIEEASDKLLAEVYFDNFNGVIVRFVKKKDSGGGSDG